MSAPLLEVHGLRRRFGGVLALDGVDMSLRRGERRGLIGPNGAGKTTLVSLLSGEVRPTSGRVVFDGADVTRLSAARRNRRGIARTFQNLRLFRTLSVFDNVVVGAQAWGGGSAWTSLLRGASLRRDAEAMSEQSLHDAGLPAEWWERPAGSLPYVQQRLVEIARAAATQPRLLLLDEPAAGANDEERHALDQTIRRLSDRGISILLIEHDIDFVLRLVDQLTVLDHGTVLASGDPETVRQDAAVIDAYLGTAVAS